MDYTSGKTQGLPCLHVSFSATRRETLCLPELPTSPLTAGLINFRTTRSCAALDPFVEALCTWFHFHFLNGRAVHLSERLILDTLRALNPGKFYPILNSEPILIMSSFSINVGGRIITINTNESYFDVDKYCGIGGDCSGPSPKRTPKAGRILAGSTPFVLLSYSSSID
jgi:hypothetical protein